MNMSPTNPLPSTSTATASAASASTSTSYTTTNATRNPTLPAHSQVPGVPGHALGPGPGSGPPAPPAPPASVGPAGPAGPAAASATIDLHSSSTPQHPSSTAWTVLSPSAPVAPTAPTAPTVATASAAPSSAVPPTHPGTGFRSVETIQPPPHHHQHHQHHHLHHQHHHATLSSSTTTTGSIPTTTTIPQPRLDRDQRQDLEGQIRHLLDQQASIQARLATLFAAHYGFDPSHELEMLRHKCHVLEDVVQHYGHQYGMFPRLATRHRSRCLANASHRRIDTSTPHLAVVL